MRAEFTTLACGAGNKDLLVQCPRCGRLDRIDARRPTRRCVRLTATIQNRETQFVDVVVAMDSGHSEASWVCYRNGDRRVFLCLPVGCTAEQARAITTLAPIALKLFGMNPQTETLAKAMDLKNRFRCRARSPERAAEIAIAKPKNPNARVIGGPNRPEQPGIGGPNRPRKTGLAARWASSFRRAGRLAAVALRVFAHCFLNLRY